MISIAIINRGAHKSVPVKVAQDVIGDIARVVLGTTFYKTTKREVMQITRHGANNFDLGAREYLFLISTTPNMEPGEEREEMRLRLIGLMTNAVEEVLPNTNFVIELQFSEALSEELRTFNARPIRGRPDLNREMLDAVEAITRKLRINNANALALA